MVPELQHGLADSRTSTHGITGNEHELLVTWKSNTRVRTYHFLKLACSSLEYGSLKPVPRQTISHHKCTQTSLTAPLPEQIVSNHVLCSIGIGLDPPHQVLQLIVASTCCLVIRATIVNVDVPPHCRANKVTHHRCTFVVSREFMPFNLEGYVVRSIHSPVGTRHGPMARLVLLLWMAFERAVSMQLIPGPRVQLTKG